ncbi:hypothetical protein [Thermococcus sp. MV5]|uniref:hypothetical protein n=1 Tax=Thermococcus sp. MV5 TaxID=1638272 RepID=UPI00197EE79D|nr:hypothetical protein [Thermococcus sp. MV5]
MMKWALVFRIEIPAQAPVAFITQFAIIYGSSGVPLPPTTPFSGVNPVSPIISIGPWFGSVAADIAFRGNIEQSNITTKNRVALLMSSDLLIYGLK